MNKPLDACLVPVTGKMVDGMRALERGAVEIALVVNDNGGLVGTLTDGDVRRALLNGATLDSPLAPYVQRNFTAVDPGTGRAEVLELMQARSISQIPVIDGRGRLVGLHLLHELISKHERKNWGLIMAGGKGTRLWPLTATVPKPMLKVAGRPILERLVLHLVGHGIRRIFLAINYLGHVVEEYFGDGQRFGCHIEYLRETKPLGTGGPVSLLPELPEAPLLILNGDLVTQANLAALFEFHTQGGYMATVGVRPYFYTVPFGCVESQDGRIARIEEKPSITKLVNAGIYVLNPEVVAAVPKDTEILMTTILEDCLNRGLPVGAYEFEEEWQDIGQWEQLKKAREGGA